MNAVRLVLAGVWVLVAVWLWLRPAGSGLAVVGPLLALAFAGLNLARWRAAQPRAVAVRRPPRPASGEYHPEFDFGAATDRSPTRERGRGLPG